MVAVSKVSVSAPRSSASAPSCLTPEAPPAPTRPITGARRNSRNSDAKRALTTLAAGDNADRHAGGRVERAAALSGGCGTDDVGSVRANEWRPVDRVDVSRAHHRASVARQKKGREVVRRGLVRGGDRNR